MAWFKQKQICSHCHTNRTNREFEGQPTCGDCEIKILMGREVAYKCPIDGMQMKKEHHEGIIIDRCTKCNGVWLDAGELNALKEALENGDSSFATGLVVGMVLGLTLTHT